MLLFVEGSEWFFWSAIIVSILKGFELVVQFLSLSSSPYNAITMNEFHVVFRSFSSALSFVNPFLGLARQCLVAFKLNVFDDNNEARWCWRFSEVCTWLRIDMDDAHSDCWTTNMSSCEMIARTNKLWEDSSSLNTFVSDSFRNYFGNGVCVFAACWISDKWDFWCSVFMFCLYVQRLKLFWFCHFCRPRHMGCTRHVR